MDFHKFSKFFINFFLGFVNQVFIIFKNFLSSISEYKSCFSNSKTLDSTFGTGIKFSFATNNTSFVLHFLSIKRDNTEDLFFPFQSILSQTSFCIKISIFSGL